jgi:ribosomal protein S18 acetylase RimI-like enzyme
MIRETTPSDVEPLLRLLRESGEFDEASLTLVAGRLEEHHRRPGEALWYTADDGEPVGVAYCAPEPVTDRTWNLLLLWTRADRQGTGLGTALVRRVREALQRRDARLLVVETSSLPAFDAARAFYAKLGFVEEARVRDFYQAGEAKVVFVRPLDPAAGA